MLNSSSAVAWLDSWDRQQEKYMADREERFQVILDVLEHVVDRPDPLVVDVGCGPGSLAARVTDRFPQAEVVGVDSDPLLLGLAEAAYGSRPGVRLVDADLRSPEWVASVALDRPVDAVVSTTALHWLYEDELARVYGDIAGMLRDGGVFADGDHVYAGPTQPRFDALLRHVNEARAERVGVDQDPNAWKRWWDEVASAPELDELLTERSKRAQDHNRSSDAYYDDRLRHLRAAGFAEAGTVWQSGDDRVLVALR